MNTSPEYKLEVKNVSLSYGDNNVLSGASLALRPGELVSVLGKSGCGKTTLFNVIAGLLAPNGGGVFLDENDVTGKSGLISYSFQKDLLLPYYTIEDNVSLPLRLKGIKKAVAKKKVADFLKHFGLEEAAKLYPGQLSGGMRQRAALLRTYMFSSEVCLLDEPFSALDTFTKTDLQEWYLKIMEEFKLTTLFITHDIDEAILLSDRILILSGKPASISGEIIIQEKRPRSREFTLTKEFLSYKKSVIKALEG